MNALSGFLLVSWLLISTMVSQAQNVAARAEAFNAVLGKEYSVRSRKKMLIIEGFREGRLVKVDKVDVFELDLATLRYSATDNTVAVKCYSDLDGCVNRVLLLNRKKSYRDRVIFAVADDASGEEIAERLKLLLEEMKGEK